VNIAYYLLAVTIIIALYSGVTVYAQIDFGGPSSNSTIIVEGEQPFDASQSRNRNTTILPYPIEKQMTNYSGIYLATNRPNYIIGQQIQIYAYAFGNANRGNDTKIDLEVTNEKASIYEVTLVIPKNKLQIISGPNTESSGIYNITASTTSTEEKESVVEFN
jgi:hypothetical protein